MLQVDLGFVPKMLLTHCFKQDPLVQYVCGMLQIQAAQGLGCSRFRLLQVWNVLDSGCSGSGMFWIQAAPGLGCSRFSPLHIRAALDLAHRCLRDWLWPCKSCSANPVSALICRLVVWGRLRPSLLLGESSELFVLTWK